MNVPFDRLWEGCERRGDGIPRHGAVGSGSEIG